MFVVLYDDKNNKYHIPNWPHFKHFTHRNPSKLLNQRGQDQAASLVEALREQGPERNAQGTNQDV